MSWNPMKMATRVSITKHIFILCETCTIYIRSSGHVPGRLLPNVWHVQTIHQQYRKLSRSGNYVLLILLTHVRCLFVRVWCVRLVMVYMYIFVFLYVYSLYVRLWFIFTRLLCFHMYSLHVRLLFTCTLLVRLHVYGLRVRLWFTCTLLVCLHVYDLHVGLWFTCTPLVYMYVHSLLVRLCFTCTFLVVYVRLRFALSLMVKYAQLQFNEQLCKVCAIMLKHSL